MEIIAFVLEGLYVDKLVDGNCTVVSGEDGGRPANHSTQGHQRTAVLNSRRPQQPQTDTRHCPRSAIHHKWKLVVNEGKEQQPPSQRGAGRDAGHQSSLTLPHHHQPCNPEFPVPQCSLQHLKARPSSTKQGKQHHPQSTQYVWQLKLRRTRAGRRHYHNTW